MGWVSITEDVTAACGTETIFFQVPQVIVIHSYPTVFVPNETRRNRHQRRQLEAFKKLCDKAIKRRKFQRLTVTEPARQRVQSAHEQRAPVLRRKQWPDRFPITESID